MSGRACPKKIFHNTLLEEQPKDQECFDRFTSLSVSMDDDLAFKSATEQRDIRLGIMSWFLFSDECDALSSFFWRFAAENLSGEVCDKTGYLSSCISRYKYEKSSDLQERILSDRNYVNVLMTGFVINNPLLFVNPSTSHSAIRLTKERLLFGNIIEKMKVEAKKENRFGRFLRAILDYNDPEFLLRTIGESESVRVLIEKDSKAIKKHIENILKHNRGVDERNQKIFENNKRAPKSAYEKKKELPSKDMIEVSFIDDEIKELESGLKVLYEIISQEIVPFYELSRYFPGVMLNLKFSPELMKIDYAAYFFSINLLFSNLRLLQERFQGDSNKMEFFDLFVRKIVSVLGKDISYDGDNYDFVANLASILKSMSMICKEMGSGYERIEKIMVEFCDSRAEELPVKADEHPLDFFCQPTVWPVLSEDFPEVDKSLLSMIKKISKMMEE